MVDLAERATEILAAIRNPLAPAAKLFSIDGKMLVTLLELEDDVAVATTPAPPPLGSIAVLARSGVRVPATIAWVEGERFGLRLDQPMSEPDAQRFAGIYYEPARRPSPAHA